MRKTQEKIAEELSISRTTWASYESGQSEPGISVFKKMAEYFQLDLDDLFSSELDRPFSSKKQVSLANLKNDNIRVLPISVDNYGKATIQFVPVHVQAGYSTGYQEPAFFEEFQHFTLPKHEHGTYRAFEISGDSMPPIQEGFIVIGQFVENWRSLKDGGRYVLALKQEGVVFKRVVCEVGKTNRLVLFSDNPQYLPFTVPLEDVLEAWEMTSYLGFPRKQESQMELILESIQKLNQDLTLQVTQSKGKKI